MSDWVYGDIQQLFIIPALKNDGHIRTTVQESTAGLVIDFDGVNHCTHQTLRQAGVITLWTIATLCSSGVSFGFSFDVEFTDITLVFVFFFFL